MRAYLETHGCPVAFYSDKHSVFRVVRQDTKGGQGMTQFGRALAELNIEILCANSSQAKGRVERANRTLQDRLVKELRLANVSSIEAGNAFLPEFMNRFNERFAIQAAKPENLHRTLNVARSRLNQILCHREQRYVGAQLTFHYDRKQIILDRVMFRRTSQANSSSSTTSQTGRSRSGGKEPYFPTGFSARTSVSTTLPS
jgi:hypothetical protein